MKILSAYKNFADKRGVLKGIINSGEWHELNYIETFAGKMRGNHYHKTTRELFFIISGDIEVSISPIDRKKTEVYHFHKGDIFIVEPLEIHAFICKTDAQWINLLSAKIDKKNPDLYTA